MSKFQPSRSQVPVDERSVLATVPGLPWWGAVLTMLAFTAVGALASGEFAGANAGVIAMAVGAVVAVLAVRNRALFTAMVQPPLIIATAIPLYRWWNLPSPRQTSQILTDVLFPMISLFPWMFWTTAVVLVIGGVRLLQYRSLTATARSAQRSSATGGAKAAKAGATKGASAKPGATKPGAAKPAAGAGALKPAAAAATTDSTAAKKPLESAGLPIAERLRAAFARLRPAPAAAGAAGAAALVADGAGRSERHQSRGSEHRSSRPARDRTDRTRADRDRADRRGAARSGTDAPARGRSSAARREDPRRDDLRRDVRRGDELRRESAARLERTREEIAARDAGAPATAVNRVVRPDSGQIPRPAMPRRPVDDDRRGVPRGARPRPAVAQGDRPRPGVPDARELRHDDERRRAVEPQPRWRTPRDPEGRPAAPAGRGGTPADARDYRREARDIDRARGGEPVRPRGERDRPRIPRDDFASLPRISGSRAAQPDLPSLSGDAERGARRGESPSSPGRYEHYRPPRYRPQSEDTAVETNFRDDFVEPAEEPRQIRRHRYKD